MAIQVTLTSLRINPGGDVDVFFSDGAGQSFPDVTTAVAWAQEIDIPTQQNIDAVKRMCLAYLAVRSPDLSTTAPVRDKAFTFDLSHAQPIRVL